MPTRFRRRTVSYHEHNEMTRAPELVIQMEEGSSIALVTDAGMPVVSDPGFRLVHLAVRHSIPVIPVPGASAFVAALAASGLPVDKFRFLGFLPSKKGERRKALEELKDATQDAGLLRGAASLAGDAQGRAGNPRRAGNRYCPGSDQSPRGVPARNHQAPPSSI